MDLVSQLIRDELRGNSSVEFILDSEKNIFHAKDCPEVDSIPYTCLVGIQTPYFKNSQPCPKCKPDEPKKNESAPATPPRIAPLMQQQQQTEPRKTIARRLRCPSKNKSWTERVCFHFKMVKPGKGRGYVGKKMSVNAIDAYNRGAKPLSKLTAADLHAWGFEYPLVFFQWLCKTGRCKPAERHHTSVAKNATKFYSEKTIRYINNNLNLDLLYRLYRGEVKEEEMSKERGIEFVRVRLPHALLGGASGRSVSFDGVLCDDLVFYSPTLSFRADEPSLRLQCFGSDRPVDFNNPNLQKIVKQLILKQPRCFKWTIKEKKQ